MNKKLLLILSSLWCCFSLPAIAETVRIPIGQQSTTAEVAKPRTGMTKAAVESTFGEPLGKNGPTGEPPISKWEYTDFVVYFEHDHVIHSVVKHRPYVD